MMENVGFTSRFREPVGWCEPVMAETQGSLLNSKAEMHKVSCAGLSSARSAAVILLGLLDLMRCRCLYL